MAVTEVPDPIATPPIPCAVISLPIATVGLVVLAITVLLLPILTLVLLPVISSLATGDDAEETSSDKSKLPVVGKSLA